MPNDDIIESSLDHFDTFVARGHAIITESLAGAQRLATEYPAVKLLLPVIAGTLHDLFNHMVATAHDSERDRTDLSGPEDFAAPADPVLDQATQDALRTKIAELKAAEVQARTAPPAPVEPAKDEPTAT